jgi:hypothetical protein
MSKANLHSDSGPNKLAAGRASHSTDESASVTSTPIAIGRSGAQETLRSESPQVPDQPKDSHTARLKQILDEPALRSLFREFLRDNFCEENLSFWLDTQDFKRKFNTTSSTSVPGGQAGAKKGTMSHQAMEKHQTELHAMAFVIYNSEPSCP